MKSEKKVEELKHIINKLREQGETYNSLGGKAGVSSATIYRIANEESNRKKKTVNKVYRALADLVPEEDEGPISGFSSPFSPKNKSPLEKEYEAIIQKIEATMSDESIPVIHKKELLNLISSLITSVKKLAQD